MAICSKCGSELADGVKFCGVCGTRVMAEEAPAASVNAEGNAAAAAAAVAAETAEKTAAAAQKTPSQTVSPYNYRNNYEEPAAGIRQAMREFAGSGLFLFYIIVTAAALIFNVLGSGMPGAIGSAFFYIPSILCLIGMILGFGDARSEDGPVGKGIGIYRVGKAIGIVYVVLFSALLILALLFSTFMVTSRPDFFDAIGKYLPSEINLAISSFLSTIGEYREAVLVVVVIIIVILVIFIVLAIFYFKGLMDAASAIRMSLENGKRTGHVPLYPAVIRIILAVFTVPGCISMLANLSTSRTQLTQILNTLDLGIDLDTAVVKTSYAVLPTIGMVLGTVALILGIILIFKLRRRINRV